MPTPPAATATHGPSSSHRLERSPVLDRAVTAAEPVAGRLVARDRVRRTLHGDATGIPVHVIATDVPRSPRSSS